MAEMDLDQDLVAQFATEIQDADRILIGTHLNPDGDALGSALGLAISLESLGKSVEVVCHHDAPANLKFLPTVGRVRQTPISDQHDLGIIVDLDTYERLGSTAEFFRKIPRIAVIDHHVPMEAPGDIRIVDVTAAATALILTRLLFAMGIGITPEVATCLYTGISTDTGSFRFRNTSSDALQAASVLLDCGADYEKVSESIFQSRPLAAARLLGHCLETMKLDLGDRVAWSALSVRDFEWAQAEDQHTEGFVNELLSIETVQVAAILREPVAGKIRCSLRSRAGYDVAAVANVFGGGGHKNAAGCTFETSLTEAEDLLISELRKCLESS